MLKVVMTFLLRKVDTQMDSGGCCLKSSGAAFDAQTIMLVCACSSSMSALTRMKRTAPTKSL